MAKEGEGRDDADTLAVSGRADQIEPGGLVGLFVEGNGNLDFRELELHKLVVGVALGVELDEDIAGLVEAVLVDEPTRALGDPVEGRQDNQGEDALQQTRKAPRPVALYPSSQC